MTGTHFESITRSLLDLKEKKARENTSPQLRNEAIFLDESKRKY